MAWSGRPRWWALSQAKPIRPLWSCCWATEMRWPSSGLMASGRGPSAIDSVFKFSTISAQLKASISLILHDATSLGAAGSATAICWAGSASSPAAAPSRSATSPAAEGDARGLAGFVPGASPIKSIRVSAPSLERAEALAPASDGALAFRLSTTHPSPSRLQREQVGAPPSMVMSHFVLPSLQALHERLVPRQRSAATSIECMAAASSRSGA